jgi:hypothetical protein
MSRCTAITSKGEACKNQAQKNKKLCKTHENEVDRETMMKTFLEMQKNMIRDMKKKLDIEMQVRNPNELNEDALYDLLDMAREKQQPKKRYPGSPMLYNLLNSQFKEKIKRKLKKSPSKRKMSPPKSSLAKKPHISFNFRRI